MTVQYFNPEGQTVTITGTTTSPTALQVPSASGVNCPVVYMRNLNATVDCMVGWGGSTQEAVANASSTVSPAQKQFLLGAAQDAIVAAQPEGFFAGITSAITVSIKVQPGTVG